MNAPDWSGVLGAWRAPSGAAVAYAEAGIPVLPLFRPLHHDGRRVVCSCGKAECKSVGKHPVGALVPHGVADASTGPEQVRVWWRWWRHANVGIATGPRSGVLVLDVDPRNGGDASLAALEVQHGALPATVRARTGSGGAHILFAWPAGVERLAGKLGQGLDVKGAGGYIVVSPSLHASGGRYAWTTPRAELAPVPAWVLDALRPPAPPPAPTLPVRRDHGDVNARAVAYLERMPESIQGANGSGRLFAAAMAMVRGFVLPDDQAVALLVLWNARCRPPWALRELARAVARARETGTMAYGSLVDAEKGRAA